MRTVAIFEKGDLELIENTPPNPCRNCHECVGRGCPEGRQWNKKYGKPLRKRKLTKQAEAYWTYLDCAKKERKAQQKKEAARKICEQHGLTSIL